MTEKTRRDMGGTMRIKKMSLLLLPLAALIAGLAIWGPEALAKYRDKGILNEIKTQEAETGTAGYRYDMSSNEKIYILSKCLNSQIQPESEQNAKIREDSMNLDYQELTGNYAMVVSRKDPAGGEISEEEGIELCNQGIRKLKELDILPDSVNELTQRSYSAAMYSAIDVPEPRNNVLVWKISLNSGKQNFNKENCLLDAYVDADTGKMYEFYVRTDISRWEDIDADALIAAWAEYMGLDQPEEYEGTNPLSETTPYFKKYVFTGMEERNTIVTVGFYEGINELFLKISR